MTPPGTLTVPLLARELGADERTLRRAIQRGALRCRRPGQRRLALEPGERDYVRTHWALLSAIARALRTEPGVRLAVLYGSTARGDERSDSDLDMLVALRHDTPAAAAALARRLENRLHRPVDIARLERVPPLLLLQALDEGRVLVDRDDRWSALRAHRESIVAAAERAAKAERTEAAAALARLVEG